MEIFFKPVHSPCASDEIKQQKIHHHHHLHHHQETQSHRHTMFDETNINSDDCLGHFHQHGNYSHILDNPHHDSHTYHQSHQSHQSEEDQILYKNDTPVRHCRASSSSLSSSSSSTFSSSWYTEASENDPFSLHHAEQPKHSLSCSNIADNGRGFREDNTSKPIVFATIKHGKTGNVFSELHTNSQKRVKRAFSSLDRGHSRSDEGPLQCDKNDLGGKQSRVPHMNYEPLHKTGLNQSLAFSAEDILLGVSSYSQRAVSSSQLPSKGILKNKEPFPDIRKAKSMEVLSTRVSKGQNSRGQKGKAMTHVEIEQARANFVQGKLQFSAFLDEITKQVISPSNLIILGVNNNKVTEKTLAPAEAYSTVKPQLPPKKHRESTREDKERHLKQQIREEGVACSSSQKHSDCSYLDELHLYASKNHHGSPAPPHYPHSTSHTSYLSNHKDKRPSHTQIFVTGDRYVSWGSHFKDGTRSSPELSQQRQHPNHKQHPAVSYRQHAHHLYQQQPQQVHSGSAIGPGFSSESSSAKSDSSMARDMTSTATSHSKEHTDQHLSQYEGHSKQSRDIVCDLDHIRALQEENTDLQQNLLQTVICIESLEVELQRTRDELSLIKEKYKSLLDTNTETKQANILLGKHLHKASETLGSERKYLLNSVSQLSSELENAHRTMAALGNINVPCLIKEILLKHFSSAEAIRKFLVIPSPASAPVPAPPAPAPSPISHSSSSLVDGELYYSKMEETAHDQLMKSEAGLQRVTAFIPVKQGVLTAQNEKPSHSPPLSIADISTAIYEKMASRHVAKPQPLYLQSQLQPPLGSKPVDSPPNHGVAECLNGKGGEKLTLLEEDIVDVNAVSAQQILDEFIRQLQPHKVGEEKDRRGGQEWANVVEHTGKAAE